MIAFTCWTIGSWPIIYMPEAKCLSSWRCLNCVNRHKSGGQTHTYTHINWPTNWLPYPCSACAHVVIKMVHAQLYVAKPVVLSKLPKLQKYVRFHPVIHVYTTWMVHTKSSTQWRSSSKRLLDLHWQQKSKPAHFTSSPSMKLSPHAEHLFWSMFVCVPW